MIIKRTLVRKSFLPMKDVSNAKILVVEDDQNISRLLKYNLEKSGMRCMIAESGEKALELIDAAPVDLIILDIMLPGMNGFGVCREIKKNPDFADIPLLMLTAKGEEIDRVLGLELGADDYVVKPFSPRELLLRVRAILKRKRSVEKAKGFYTAGSLIIDTARHKVMVGKKEIELTAMEFNLLLTLVQRRGRVQTRETLLEDVWDIASDVTTRTVDTHVKRLRQKLGKAGILIETVRGVGYRFQEEE